VAQTVRSHTASRDGRFDVLAEACPTRQVINRIGDRWSLLVLYALERQTLRFQELRRTVDGISQKMLTQTLRALERDGLVHREAQPTNPPRVDYELTPLGREVAERLLSLIHHLEGRMDDVLAARERYDGMRGGV